MRVNRKSKKNPYISMFTSLPRKYDFPLFFCCLLLSLIGIVYIGSASMSTMFNNLSGINNSVGAMWVMIWAVVKQSAFLVLSLIVMCFVSNLYRFEKFRFPLSSEHYYHLKEEIRVNFTFLPMIMAIIGGLLLVCLVFPAINGAHAWINLGFMTLQPAEFAKVAMIMMVAGTFCKARAKANWVELIKPVLLVFLAYFFIILVLQKDLGSAVVLAFVTVSCCMICTDERLRKVQYGVAIFMGVCLVGALFILSPIGTSVIEHLPLSEYQINRIITSVDPFYDRYGAGFQVSNSLIAFARGGWLGSGLGTSIQKFGYLPFADSDFIVAVIAEEGGLLTLSFIFLLYGIILFRLIKYAVKVKKDEHKVILIGTATYLFVHILFNVGGATAFIPLTGVPLLMLSSGGSSLMAWFAAIGLSQSVIARYRRGEE